MRLGKLLATGFAGVLGAIVASAPASAHWVGAGSLAPISHHTVAGQSAKAYPSRATSRAATGIGPHVVGCTMWNDNSQDASDVAGATPATSGNIDSLDLTSGTLATDGTNLIATLSVINLGGLQGQPVSQATYNPFGETWIMRFTDAKGHKMYLSASWMSTLATDIPGDAQGSPTGFVFTYGYTTVAATGNSLDNGVGSANGAVDFSKNTITLWLPLSQFAYGDGTTSHTEALNVGDLLTTESGETFWAAGGVAVEAEEVADTDQPDGDNFTGYVIGHRGCAYA